MTPLEFIKSQIDKPCKESNTLDELGLDSLDFIDLVRMCEGEFNILIADSYLMKVKTVGDLVNLVSILRNASQVCS